MSVEQSAAKKGAAGWPESLQAQRDVATAAGEARMSVAAASTGVGLAQALRADCAAAAQERAKGACTEVVIEVQA